MFIYVVLLAYNPDLSKSRCVSPGIINSNTTPDKSMQNAFDALDVLDASMIDFYRGSIADLSKQLEDFKHLPVSSLRDRQIANMNVSLDKLNKNIKKHQNSIAERREYPLPLPIPK